LVADYSGSLANVAETRWPKSPIWRGCWDAVNEVGSTAGLLAVATLAAE
jgi:hypothetical protein